MALRNLKQTIKGWGRLCFTSYIHTVFQGELSSVPVRRLIFVSFLHKGIHRSITISIFNGKTKAPRATYTQVNSSGNLEPCSPTAWVPGSKLMLFCKPQYTFTHHWKKTSTSGLTANGLKSALMETLTGTLPETHQTEGRTWSMGEGEWSRKSSACDSLLTPRAVPAQN